MIHKKYKHIIQNDEKVLFFNYYYRNRFFVLKVFSSIMMIAVAFSILFITSLIIDEIRIGAIIILSPIFIILFRLNKLIEYHLKKSNSLIQNIITSKRIYLFNNKETPPIIYDLKHIINLNKGLNNLILYSSNKSNPKTNIIHINSIEPYEQDHIRAAWFDNSSYQIMNNEFKKISDKYNLTLSPFKLDLEQNEKLKLSGTINDIEILVSINSINRLQSVDFIFKCSNEEQNYLLVKKEGKKEQFSKKLGMQDIQTGNQAFDDNFLLQSNNQTFFDFIMTENTQINLDSIWSNLNGVLRMGETEKMPKIIQEKEKHPIINSSILDEHLVHDSKNNNKKKREKISQFTTPLIYRCNDLTPLINEPQLLSDRLIYTFEIMLNIALRIQEYDKK